MEDKKSKKKISVPVLIINIIVTALFLFVFACLCTVMVQNFTGKEPTLFGYRSYVVITDSMTGTYDKGDVILVKVLDAEELEKDPSAVKEGDVVTFVAPEGFGTVEGYTVTHRVVEEPYKGEDGRWYVRTKGDAVQTADSVPVPLDNVTGLVKGKSEALAKLQTVLKSKTGFMFLIIIPLILIAVWQIAVFAVAGVKQKHEKELSSAKENERDTGSEEERIKKIKESAVEEYLRQKDCAEGGKENCVKRDSEDVGDGTRDDRKGDQSR